MTPMDGLKKMGEIITKGGTGKNAMLWIILSKSLEVRYGMFLSSHKDSFQIVRYGEKESSYRWTEVEDFGALTRERATDLLNLSLNMGTRELIDQFRNRSGFERLKKMTSVPVIKHPMLWIIFYGKFDLVKFGTLNEFNESSINIRYGNGLIKKDSYRLDGNVEAFETLSKEEAVFLLDRSERPKDIYSLLKNGA